MIRCHNGQDSGEHNRIGAFEFDKYLLSGIKSGAEKKTLDSQYAKAWETLEQKMTRREFTIY